MNYIDTINSAIRKYIRDCSIKQYQLLSIIHIITIKKSDFCRWFFDDNTNIDRSYIEDIIKNGFIDNINLSYTITIDEIIENFKDTEDYYNMPLNIAFDFSYKNYHNGKLRFDENITVDDLYLFTEEYGIGYNIVFV